MRSGPSAVFQILPWLHQRDSLRAPERGENDEKAVNDE